MSFHRFCYVDQLVRNFTRCWTNRSWFLQIHCRRQTSFTSSWNIKQVETRWCCSRCVKCHMYPHDCEELLRSLLLCLQEKSGAQPRHRRPTASSSLTMSPTGKWAHWRPLLSVWRTSSPTWSSCRDSIWWRVRGGSCGRSGWRRSGVFGLSWIYKIGNSAVAFCHWTVYTVGLSNESIFTSHLNCRLITV